MLRLVSQKPRPMRLHTSSTTSTSPSCRGPVTFDDAEAEDRHKAARNTDFAAMGSPVCGNAGKQVRVSVWKCQNAAVVEKQFEKNPKGKPPLNCGLCASPG